MRAHLKLTLGLPCILLLMSCESLMESGFGKARELVSPRSSESKVVIATERQMEKDGRPTVYSYQLLFRASVRESDLILLQRAVSEDKQSAYFVVERFHGRGAARNMTSLTIVVDGRRYLLEDSSPDRAFVSDYVTETLRIKVKAELFHLLSQAQKVSFVINGSEVSVENDKVRALPDAIATLESLGYEPPAEQTPVGPSPAGRGTAEDMTDRG